MEELKPEIDFNEMPEEVHLKIFLYLSAKHRQEIRAVCSKWREILDEDPSVVINNQNFERTMKLRQGMVFVKIRNLTTEVKDIVFKQTIRRLEFWDVVVSYNLLHFLRECSQVEQLNFGNVTLDSFDKRMRCPQGFHLPQVKTMRFYTKWRVQFSADELILFDFLRQIRFDNLETVFIHELFPNYLNEFELQDPFFKVELPSGLKSTEFLLFLLENSRTVKRFGITGDLFRPFGSPIEEFSEQIERLQLEELRCCIRKATEFTADESLVIQGQRFLKNLWINAFYHCWPAVVRAIEASASSLTNVNITISAWLPLDQMEDMTNFGPSNILHLDASIFNNCSKLTNLTLSNPYVRLSNLTSLPESIQSLRLSVYYLTLDDLLAIASKLNKLREFNLNKTWVGLPAMQNNEIIQAINAFIQIETFEHFMVDWWPMMDKSQVENLAKSQDRFETIFTPIRHSIPGIGKLEMSKILPPAEPGL